MKYSKPVYVCVCMFQHNFGMPEAISTKLGTHMTIYIYINILYMCVCGYVCSSITLERLERFQPNLVHMTIYIIKLLRLYTIDKINSFSCLIEDWNK
jgi:hypothetical protein